MNKKYLNENPSFLSSNIINEIEPRLIRFYNINGKLIFENKYSLEKKISEVIDDFINKNPENILVKTLKFGKNFNKINLSYYIKINDTLEKIENKNQPLSSFIYNVQDTLLLLISRSTAITNDKPLKIYVKYEHIYKYLAENMEEYISDFTHLIGKPMLNHLRYYLYNKYTKNLKLIKYNKEDIIKYELKSFSTIDAYCNAKNFLYIYENISNNENINSRFIRVNLLDNHIFLISSEFPKRILHSMIYIPERYIFIIGGKEGKEALVYEIKENNNKYDKYPYLLPYYLLEPSLIYINNKYLYAFENSKLDFQILRIDLISISPFEDIKLKNKKYLPINQKFFGVVRNKNSILFLGGQMINLNNELINNCFEFHYDCNKLYISKRVFKPFDFFEKTFIPIGNEIYMQLSETQKLNKYEPKIILFDGSKQDVEQSEEDT